MTVHTLAMGVRMGCAILMLSAAALFAAEKSPLLGLTREQLLDKLGEPKSQLAAGGREVILFTRERVVLRNGVVVEVDILPPDFGARRATPAPAPAAPAAAANPAPAPNAAPVTGDPTPNAGNPPPQAPAAPGPATVSAAAPVATGTTETPAPAPVAPPEPQLAIKSVRPPSAGPARPAPKAEPTAAPVATTPPPTAAPSGASAKSESAPTPATKTVATSVTPNAAPPAPAAEKAPEPAPAPEPAVAATDTPAPNAEPAADRPEGADAAAAAEPKNGKSKKTTPRRQSAEPDFPEPEEAIFTGRTYLFAVIIIGAGAGFLIWQRKQRQLELAASAVSRPPFSFAPAANEGATFPSDLLSSLEWKRFEELVAAYYSKTGVVAVRTKSGPDSPVHIKISWKGESRPFALVQCIAHPMGLVDAPRIQELFAVLTAEDIRRGYVVTTGKFNVSARDFAEEKHITLLSGDLLLEKVNALPPPVRTELIQEFSVGDYTTPSCPKCDAKMVLSEDDPKVWQCKAHPDTTVRAWK